MTARDDAFRAEIFLDTIAGVAGTIDAMMIGGCVAHGEALINLRAEVQELAETARDLIADRARRDEAEPLTPLADALWHGTLTHEGVAHDVAVDADGNPQTWMGGRWQTAGYTAWGAHIIRAWAMRERAARKEAETLVRTVTTKCDEAILRAGGSMIGADDPRAPIPSALRHAQALVRIWAGDKPRKGEELPHVLMEAAQDIRMLAMNMGAERKWIVNDMRRVLAGETTLQDVIEIWDTAPPKEASDEPGGDS